MQVKHLNGHGKQLKDAISIKFVWPIQKTKQVNGYGIPKLKDSHASCIAQTGYAAFGKGVQLISGSPAAETELTSPS